MSPSEMPSAAPEERALFEAHAPLPEPEDRQASEVLTRLARAHGSVTRQLERVCSRYGISEPKFNVLLSLARAEGYRLPLYMLSDRLFVCRSNITALIDRLEDDGLVRRIHDPVNRRQVLAELTPAGYERLLAVLPEHWASERHAVAVLSEAERQELSRLLEKLARGND